MRLIGYNGRVPEKERPIMTPVEIVPAETILPTDLPGDDLEAEREIEEMLECLRGAPEEAPTIEVEAVTVE